MREIDGKVDLKEVMDEFQKRPVGHMGCTHLTSHKCVLENGRKYYLTVKVNRDWVERCKDCGSKFIVHIDISQDEIIYECPDKECNRITRRLSEKRDENGFPW